jgi:hypothetical protein
VPWAGTMDVLARPLLNIIARPSLHPMIPFGPGALAYRNIPALDQEWRIAPGVYGASGYFVGSLLGEGFCRAGRSWGWVDIHLWRGHQDPEGC